MSMRMLKHTSDAALLPVLYGWVEANQITAVAAKESRAVDAAYLEQIAALGPPPVQREMTGEELATFRTIPIGELANVSFQNHEEHKAAHAAWVAARERIARKTSYAASERKFNRVVSRECRAAEKVLRFPVRTLEGLAAKLDVHAKFGFHGEELADALLRDVPRILKAQRA